MQVLNFPVVVIALSIKHNACNFRVGGFSYKMCTFVACIFSGTFNIYTLYEGDESTSSLGPNFNNSFDGSIVSKSLFQRAKMTVVTKNFEC